MTFYDLNPGDIVRITPKPYRVNIFRRDISKEDLEISFLKLDDSFPRAIIQVPMIETQKDINGKEFIVRRKYINYSCDADEIEIVDHKSRNNKRWRWITDRINIGDNYPTLYYSVIARNEFAKYNWQTWGDDGYYHCPFCDKKLNTTDEIEETEKEKASKIKLKSCDCEGWKKRSEKYEKYIETKASIEKLEKELLESTELPWRC